MRAHELPKLKFELNGLEPVISKEQLQLHYEKHHQGYVTNSNNLFAKLKDSRTNSTDVDQKAILKNISFNLAGHILHTVFWDVLNAPKDDNGPIGEVADAIKTEFDGFEQFKSEFSKAAISTEGSGWAALCSDNGGNLCIMQIEKHNVNIVPELKLLLVIDVWEHAYYLDYKNARPKFVEEFWKIVDWESVNKRYNSIKA